MLDNFRETAITWDKANRKVYEPLRASAGDNKGRKLSVQVVNGGVVENITGSSLSLFWETRDKAHRGLDVFTAVDATKGKFEIYYTTGMLSNEGVLNANLVLVDTSGRVVSEPFTITVFKGIDDDAIQSEDSFTALTQALIDISNLEQNYASRLNDLTAQLQQTEQELTAQLAQKITQGVGGVTDADLSQEVKEQMTGGSVAVVGKNAILEENIVDEQVTPKKTNFISQSENLFNKNDNSIISGKLINNSGALLDYGSGRVSHLIPVSPNDTITAFFNPASFGSNAMLFLYDEAGTYLYKVVPTFTGQIGTATVPNDVSVKAVKINVKKDNLDTVMLVKSANYPGSYIPFTYKLKNEFTLNDTQKDEVSQVVSDFAFPNPLEGKIAVFDGDSIANAINDSKDGWAGRIAGNNNMAYTNYAVDGGTITAGLLTSGGANRYSVSRSVANYRADADYIILEGGTNDSDLIGVANMGEISVGFDATLDDTTFTGAVESTLKQVILKYPGKKIGFIIAHKMGSMVQQIQRKKFFDRIMECCRKWGVPYLNLWETCYINPMLPSLKTLYYSDNQHLTTSGYELITPIIERWMKTL